MSSPDTNIGADIGLQHARDLPGAKTKDPLSPFLVSLVSGGMAGTAVDVALFPLDTIKTRLQSPQGFLKAGGLSGIYKGLGAAAVGSAPGGKKGNGQAAKIYYPSGAALFFSAYEASKKALGETSPISHMAAASVGEVVACLVRVPTENVKQKLQAGMFGSARETIGNIMKEGGVGGFFTGYLSTVAREIPFSLVQFPIYERLKIIGADLRGKPLDSYQAALCGSLSGGVAAAVTTPIDVIKTRLMLGKDKEGVKYRGIVDTFRRVHQEGGVRMLFSGVTPRVTWISIGGFFFFGVYETSKTYLSS